MAENEGKPKSLWNSFQRIPYKFLDAILPDHTNLVLANMFGHFFSEKIFKIRFGFQSSSPTLVIRPSHIISRRRAGWEIIKRIPCVSVCVTFLKRAVHHTGCFSLAFSMFYDLIAYVFSFDAVFSDLGA